ncbi:unnamed protein product, partial [Brassica rapa]
KEKNFTKFRKLNDLTEKKSIPKIPLKTTYRHRPTIKGLSFFV